MGKRKTRIAAPDKGMIDQAEAAVRDTRSVARTKLPRWKELEPEAQEQLVTALLSRGLEAGEKGAVRVPLREQATSLAQGGARVAWKAAQKRIVGASAADRDRALADVLGDGTLRLVVRTRADIVVGGREEVLAPEEVERLVEAHRALGSVLAAVRKKVSSKGPLATVTKTLLREDAADLLAPLSLRAGADRKSQSEPDWKIVMDHLQQMERAPILLVWVPDLVKSLSSLMTPEQARSALLDARQRGLIELRPESGVGRLPAADAALCPRDADGLPLSNALRLSTG